MAKEDAAIKAGPMINFIAIANAAILVPQAIILGREAMKRPVEWCIQRINFKHDFIRVLVENQCERMLIPKLNIAIPSPPLDSISIDLSMIAGNFTPHLQ